VGTLTYTFESDTVGTPPANWSFFRESVPGSGGYINTTNTVIASGKSIVIDSNSGASQIEYTCDETGTLSDCVIDGRFLRTGANRAARVRLRVSGTGASPTYYGFDYGNNYAVIYKVVAGSLTALTDGAVTCGTVSTYFKAEASGTTLRLKVWTGAEPGTWDLSTTDSDISSGGVALGATYSVYFDDIAITSSDLDTDVTQDPLGTLTVTGYDPVVKINAQIYVGDPFVGDPVQVFPDIQVEGFNPYVAAATENTPSAIGTLEIAGFDPTVTAPVGVAVAPLGELSITGYDPVVTYINTAVPVGTLTITGYDPTVTASASAVHLYFKFKDENGNVWTREIDSKPPVTEVTTTYIASSRDEIILADASGGAFTITMPTATGREGFIYTIKKTDSSANAVTVAGTIDGDTDFDLLSQDESITIVSDNSAWWIL